MTSPSVSTNDREGRNMAAEGGSATSIDQLAASALARAMPEGASIDPCPFCEGRPPQRLLGTVYRCTPCGGVGVYTKPARDPITGERHGWNVCRYGGCQEPCGDHGGCSA